MSLTAIYQKLNVKKFLSYCIFYKIHKSVTNELHEEEISAMYNAWCYDCYVKGESLFHPFY